MQVNSQPSNRTAADVGYVIAPGGSAARAARATPTSTRLRRNDVVVEPVWVDNEVNGRLPARGAGAHGGLQARERATVGDLPEHSVEQLRPDVLLGDRLGLATPPRISEFDQAGARTAPVRYESPHRVAWLELRAAGTGTGVDSPRPDLDDLAEDIAWARHLLDADGP
jgi:hypothetical protein